LKFDQYFYGGRQKGSNMQAKWKKELVKGEFIRIKITELNWVDSLTSN
jgi:hypothetical protein